MPHPLIEAAARYRAEIAAGEATASQKLLDVYLRQIARLEPELRNVVAEISDQGLTPDLAFQRARAQSLIKQLGEELAQTAATAGARIEARQAEVVAAAIENARKLVELQLGDPPANYSGPTWTHLPADQIKDLIGFTVEGAPVREALRQLVPAGLERIQRALLDGLIAGEPPERVVGGLREAIGQHAAKVLTVARTAEMQSYRTATHRAFLENSDIIAGWTWLASLSPGTCLSCLALHGRFFPVQQPQLAHWNCRCIQIPKTKSWAELGYPNVQEGARAQWQSGEEWLRDQSEETQKRALGPSRLAAWDSGAVELKDFIAHDVDPLFGPMFRETSLKQALENAAAKRPDPAGGTGPEPKPKAPPKAPERPSEPPPTPPASPTPPTPPAAPPAARRAARRARQVPTEPAPSAPTPGVDPAAVFDIELVGAQKRDAEAAIDAIRSVHRIVGPIEQDKPLRVFKSKGVVTKALDGAEAAYFRTQGTPEEPMFIALHSRGSAAIRRHVVLHEIGHFFDHRLIGSQSTFATKSNSPLIAGLMRALAASNRITELESVVSSGMLTLPPGAAVSQVPATPKDLKYIKYLLRPHEQFARAYAQWISVRSGDAELMAQLRTFQPTSRLRIPMQWSDEDFEPIAREFDDLFKSLGMIL